MASASASASETRIELTIREDKLYEDSGILLQYIRPHWIQDNITYKVFTDGITNKLVGCFYEDDDDVVLVRVYGNKTDLVIDRKQEVRNMRLLHKMNLAPCLYAVFSNGLAYKYVPGNTLSVADVREPGIWRLVARQMANMHKVKQHPQIPVEPMVWKKSRKLLGLIPTPYSSPEKEEKFGKLIKPIPELESELEELEKSLEVLQSPIVFAHNDLLLGNIIYDKSENKVTFIDYEYADYNYQAFDIGNHFAEFVGISDIDYEKRYPGEEFQMEWLKEYLVTYTECGSAEVEWQEVRKLFNQVNHFVSASHFFWGLWALIQAEYSNIHFDFLQYASIRFNEYYKRKSRNTLTNGS